MITNLRSDYVYGGSNDVTYVDNAGTHVLVASGQNLGDYVSYRDALIKVVEKPEMMAYPEQSFGFDNVNGNPTLGYGFDFTQLTTADIFGGFAAASVMLTQAQIDLINDYKSGAASGAQLIASSISINDAQATAFLDYLASSATDP